MFKRVSNLLALSLLLASASVSAAFAQESGSAAIGGSVQVTKHANKAASAWNQGDFGTARDEFTKCIGYDASNPEFYQGVIESCEKLKDYARVTGALEKLFSIAPDKKKFYEYDYGVALYNLNRYDEAVPHLKAALATADITPPPFKPLQVNIEDLNGSGGPSIKIAPAPSGGDNKSSTTTSTKATSTSGGLLPEDTPGVDSETGDAKMARELMTYDNAIRSEAIVIAEYEGYEPSAAIRYNSPPKANFHLFELLKGPPFNRALPVRFAFHIPNASASQAPPGWKFDDKAVMPEKGSKWILFIEWAVPERGQYNTYYGSYGRQPATEANLDKLDRLLESHNMKFLQK